MAFLQTRSKSHHGQPGKVEQAFTVESEQEVWLKVTSCYYFKQDPSIVSPECVKRLSRGVRSLLSELLDIWAFYHP